MIKLGGGTIGELKSGRSARELNQVKIYRILSFYGLIFILFGFIVDSPGEIFTGLYKIIIDPDFLITDYFSVGGVGATFVNSGILTLISIFILYKLKVEINGASISTIWLMSGFALFGKNIANIWFIILGVAIYAWYQNTSVKKYIYIALLGTALSPIVTQVIFGFEIPMIISFPLGAFLGILIGFILSPLASYLMRVHQGFNLYNIGFTSGIIGTILVAVFKSYGFEAEKRSILSSGNNLTISVFLISMLFIMFLTGYVLNGKSLKGLKNIYNYHGRLVTDFVLLEGFPVTLMNMAINGTAAVMLVLLVGGEINGPIIGGIFTVIGFSAFGKHLKNMTPIVIGVMLGNITTSSSLGDSLVLLAALFGTTLAPIAGEFGWVAGIIAGFLHSSLTLHVGYLHAGFNLYNNGFSGGLVAAIMVPIIEALRKDDSSESRKAKSIKNN